MEWTLKRCPLALSEEATRRDLFSKKAGHVIVHFGPKVKLHLGCNFVSASRGSNLPSGFYKSCNPVHNFRQQLNVDRITGFTELAS